MNGIILFISCVRYVIDETICLPFGLVGVIAGEVGAYGRRIAMRFKRRRDEIIASERAGHANFVSTYTRSQPHLLTSVCIVPVLHHDNAKRRCATRRCRRPG